MENERKAKLLATLKEFNKEQKEEVFTMGDEIEELPVIPSGIALFDDFIGGGFKKGAHTIVWSKNPSEGKTTLILQTVSNAQKLGFLVCYVNTEKPISPSRFEQFGINLKELVYIEAPSNAEKVLEAVRRLCKDKVIDLFIIDSENGLSPKSVQEESSGKERSLEKKNVASLPLVLSNFYSIVNSHVFRSKASIIWIAQGRTQGIGGMFAHVGLSGGKAQSFFAYQILMLRADEKSNAPVQKFKEWWMDPEQQVRYRTKNEPCGFGVVMKLTKTNSCKSKKENSELSIPFLYSQGFVSEIKEETDLPVVIDAKNDEERKLIEVYVIEKKPEDAIKLGLIKEELKNEDLVQVQEEVTIAVEEPKKKRGRKKGSTNGEKN
jgi:recombination protein RecA